MKVTSTCHTCVVLLLNLCNASSVCVFFFFFISCLHRFGGNEGHDPHILYTLSALQVMALLGELDRVDKDKVWPTLRYTGGGGRGTTAVVSMYNEEYRPLDDKTKL